MGTNTRNEDGALGPYRQAVLGRWRLVLAIIVVAVGAAGAFLALRSPTYEATAKILVTPLPAGDPAFAGIQPVPDNPTDTTRTMQTAATVVRSPVAARRTGSNLDPTLTGREVLDDVEVQPEGESNLLALTARATSATRAQGIANQFARDALEVRGAEFRRKVGVRIDQLERERPPRSSVTNSQLARLRALARADDPTLSIAEVAEAPTSPSDPPSWLVIGLGVIGGLAIGAGAALLMDLLDRRVRDEDELLSIYPLPVLARLPEGSGAPEEAHAAEAFRTLVAQLDSRRQPDNGSACTVMVTSPSAGDGKTSSAVGLAVALGQAGHRVILLDLDLRHARAAGRAGLSIADDRTLLALDGDLERALEWTDPPLLRLAVAGLPRNEGELGSFTRRLPRIVADARELADWVVVDTAPLGVIGDAVRLIPEMDEILLVAWSGKTDRQGLRETRALVDRHGHVPTGYLLVGDAPRNGTQSYDYDRLQPVAS